MEAIEATQFNDLNESLGIPIPDSGKNAQRSQQRRKKRAQKRVRYGECFSIFQISGLIAMSKTPEFTKWSPPD